MRVRGAVGRDPDRVRLRRDRRRRRPRRRPRRHRRSRRYDRRARHVRRLGHARARVPDGSEPGGEARDRSAACSTAVACTSSGSRRSAWRRRWFTFSLSFAILFLFKITFGIRTEAEVEEAGLDVSEHGMGATPSSTSRSRAGTDRDAQPHGRREAYSASVRLLLTVARGSRRDLERSPTGVAGRRVGRPAHHSPAG